MSRFHHPVKMTNGWRVTVDRTRGNGPHVLEAVETLREALALAEEDLARANVEGAA